MRNYPFETLEFVNATGNHCIISDSSVNCRYEMIGRTGFTAPDVNCITETYANGVTKVLGRLLNPRTVSISMLAVGKNPAQLDAEFSDMIGTLMDVSNGTDGKLYIKRTDGSTVYLNCLYSGGANVKEEYRRFRKFTLDFFAADPYFYRDLDDLFIEVPVSARLTLHDGLMLGTGHVLGENTGTGERIVYNNGSEPIQPIMRISRVKGSLSIVNLTNDNRIEFEDIIIPKGDNLVIDTRDTDKQIYIEHKDHTIAPAGQYLNWGNIEFDFNIIPGENIIRFQTSERSTTEGISLKMFERYLSA